MIKKPSAVQAFALLGVLVLTSCGGGSNSSRDMYKGERQGPILTAPKPTPKLPERRLAAIKAYGLDTQANPSLLLGLSKLDVEQTLGAPSFVRKDKGVEIWQYKQEDCILDLFLYEDNKSLSVNHTELRGPMLDSAGELSCFKRIVMGETS